MGSTLSPAQRRRYERDGFIFPVAVLTPEEACAYRRAYEGLEPRLALAGLSPPHAQCHLHFPWAFELATHAAILDCVEDLIGPDILVHSTTCFSKPAHDPGFVSWHQDAYNWRLDEPRLVSAWVALTASTPENGCMRALPGTHLRRLSHEQRPHPDNMLKLTGLNVQLEFDEADAVDFVLAPGEISLHHADLVHGSEPNRSDDERIGFAIRYVSPEVGQVSEHHPVVLARGRDDHGNYEHQSIPPPPDLTAGVAAHNSFWQRRAA